MKSIKFSALIFASLITNKVISMQGVNSKLSTGETLLHIKASIGDLETVKELLDGKASVDERNKYEETALHKAAFAGHSKVIDLLCAAGADPNAEDNIHTFPLTRTVTYGHVEATEALCRGGADILVKDLIYGTLLGTAVFHGKDAILRFLLSREKTNVSAKEEESGNTALHIAARLGRRSECIRILMSGGAVPNEQNNHGETPLILAIKNKILENVEALCESDEVRYNADKIFGSDGKSALDWASSSAECLQALHRII